VKNGDAPGAETFQMPSGGPVNRPVPMKRSEGGAVRVCTYNIGWAAGSPTHPGCWASRRADVAALVRSSSPDVVAFQEVVPAQAGAPVVLAGDFNSNETDTAPMFAAKEMTYALYASETPPTGPWGTTCAGFRRKSPPTSFADAQRVPLSERCTKEGTRRYGERIDYIFVSKGVRVLDYATYDVLRPGLDLYPSDHFPVVATLMVNYPDEHHKQNNLRNDGRAQMARTS